MMADKSYSGNKNRGFMKIPQIVFLSLIIIIGLSAIFILYTNQTSINVSDISGQAIKGAASSVSGDCNPNNGVSGEISDEGICSLSCRVYIFNPHKDCKNQDEYDPSRDYCHKGRDKKRNVCVECIQDSHCRDYPNGVCKSKKECEYKNMPPDDDENEPPKPQCPQGCLKCNSQGVCIYANSSTCYPACEYNEGCNEDAYPPRCEAAECGVAGKQCYGGLVCKNKLCVRCEDDSDCPSGQSCIQDPNPQVPAGFKVCSPLSNPPTSNNTPSGNPIPECNCNSSQICLADGTCQDAKACNYQNKCPEGQYCGNEICRPLSCENTNDCEMGKQCKNGRCVVDPDFKCKKEGGLCQNNWNSCKGEYKQELCGGGTSRQCCIPNPNTGDDEVDGLTNYDKCVPSDYKKVFENAEKNCGSTKELIAAIFKCGEHHGYYTSEIKNGIAIPEVDLCEYSWPSIDGPWKTSNRGAKGPFQFTDLTWLRYRSDGNSDGKKEVQNVYDSSCAAAKLLENGGPHRYNPTSTRWYEKYVLQCQKFLDEEAD